MIIDFHTHTFPAAISEKVLAKLSRLSHTQYFTDGSVNGLLASMKEASVDYSVNLPVMTSAEQVEKVNRSLIADKETLAKQGIITFGGMHPEYNDYKKELQHLKESGIPGIKIHPAYQNTDIDDIKFLRIIDCASELGLVVLTHAGIDIGIYNHNYASVKQILSVLDQVHPEKFVLAHMGNWGCWEDVERDLAGAPVWLDTAFSIGAVTPDKAKSGEPYLSSNLSKEDFVRIVRKHGADKILFATDSPWEAQKDYVQRIDTLPFTEAEKETIFYKNAKELLSFD
ncbi:MAG: amidohydrolase family protein [Lachnospiraceae bacterium]|nr:amidohydrolase family protein [Lachnospiraceae bacterium]